MEIRASLVVPETGVQDTNRLAIGSAKIGAAQTLMLPDDLQQVLGRRAHWGISQSCSQSRIAPLGIEIGGTGIHSVAHRGFFCQIGFVPLMDSGDVMTVKTIGRFCPGVKRAMAHYEPGRILFSAEVKAR